MTRLQSLFLEDTILFAAVLALAVVLWRTRRR